MDSFCRRVAAFDKKPLIRAKSLVNERAGLPNVEDMAASGAAFLECAGLPETQARGALFTQRGLQEAGELELRLGHHLALLRPSASTLA